MIKVDVTVDKELIQKLKAIHDAYLIGARAAIRERMATFPGVNDEQRQRIEELLTKFTESYFKGDATITEAFRVAFDEIHRFHIPFLLGLLTQEQGRDLALSSFSEIGVDLVLLPVTDDNAAIVAAAVSAWTHYVRVDGMRSRDAAWQVVGELGDVIGGVDAV